MPGPIVEVITRFLKYLPFEDCGFTFTIVSTIVSKFSNNLSSSKEIFPIGTCKFDDLSTRYSTLPALISFTAFSTSIVTVLFFGFVIKPFGQKNFLNLPTSAFIQGVVTITSNSNQHSFI